MGKNSLIRHKLMVKSAIDSFWVLSLKSRHSLVLFSLVEGLALRLLRKGGGIRTHGSRLTDNEFSSFSQGFFIQRKQIELVLRDHIF